MRRGRCFVTVNDIFDPDVSDFDTDYDSTRSASVHLWYTTMK
jgi:hypothetical protein